VYTFLLWKSIKYGITYSECVSIFLPQVSIVQSACAAFYCHLWPLWLYHILAHCIINSTVFEKYFSIHLFLCNFVWNISHLRRIKWDTHIGVHVKHLLFLSNFNETLIFEQKPSNIKFHNNPSSGSWDVSTGTNRQSARYDEADSRLSQFCEIA